MNSHHDNTGLVGWTFTTIFGLFSFITAHDFMYIMGGISAGFTAFHYAVKSFEILSKRKDGKE